MNEAPVDDEIQGNAQGKAVHADHVFNHGIGGFGRKPSLRPGGQQFRLERRCRLEDFLPSLLEGKIVEVGNARGHASFLG
jgi:hypothetical protein